MSNATVRDPNYVSEWTIMVYFAADNNLDEVAFKNLQLMKQAGSNSKVNIIAQLDSRGIEKMVRFRLRDTRTTLEEDILEVQDEVNTGLGSELTKFVNWGMKEFKANRHMLVIWGHGEGWQSAHDAHRAAGRTVNAVRTVDDGMSMSISNKGEVKVFFKDNANKTISLPKAFLEALAKANSIVPDISTPGEGGSPLGVANLLLGMVMNTADASQDLLKQTIPILVNGINSFLGNTGTGPDGESDDVLTNKELKIAIKNALANSDCPQLEILAMDACLMGMAETGYQVREQVKYLVASEDTVPLNSWPYDRIFSRLVAEPEMLTEDFVEVIIREYLIHYRDYAKGVTLSACKPDADTSNKLMTAVKDLANILAANISQPEVLKVVLAARALAQSFYLKEFIDLYDFCNRLEVLSDHEKIKGKIPSLVGTIHTQCRKVMDAIYVDKKPEDKADSSMPIKLPSTFVHSYGHCGFPVKNARGISIYFPLDQYPNPKYLADLEFVTETGWGEFLTNLLREIGIPEPIKESSSAGNALTPPAGNKAGAQKSEDLSSTGEIKVPQGTDERLGSSLKFGNLLPGGGKERNHPSLEEAKRIKDELRRLAGTNNDAYPSPEKTKEKNEV